jgi:hypothetical protein
MAWRERNVAAGHPRSKLRAEKREACGERAHIGFLSGGQCSNLQKVGLHCLTNMKRSNPGSGTPDTTERNARSNRFWGTDIVILQTDINEISSRSFLIRDPPKSTSRAGEFALKFAWRPKGENAGGIVYVPSFIYLFADWNAFAQGAFRKFPTEFKKQWRLLRARLRVSSLETFDCRRELALCSIGASSMTCVG